MKISRAILLALCACVVTVSFIAVKSILSEKVPASRSGPLGREEKLLPGGTSPEHIIASPVHDGCTHILKLTDGVTLRGHLVEKGDTYILFRIEDGISPRRFERKDVLLVSEVSQRTNASGIRAINIARDVKRQVERRSDFWQSEPPKGDEVTK